MRTLALYFAALLLAGPAGADPVKAPEAPEAPKTSGAQAGAPAKLDGLVAHFRFDGTGRDEVSKAVAALYHEGAWQ